VEVPRGEGQWLFVSLANSYIRIGDERFGSESREIPVGFYPMASADLWKPPATQGGPNGGNKLQVKRTAALAVARFVFAVEGVVRPTVTQKDPAVVAEFAFRRCWDAVMRMEAEREGLRLVGRLAVAVVGFLLALQRHLMRDMKAQILYLPVFGQTERQQPVLPVVQRTDLAADLPVIGPLSLDRVMFELAAWLAVVVAVVAAVAVAVAAAAAAPAAAALAAEDLFVPCSAEPIPSLHLLGCLHLYRQKPSVPCMEGHRPVATLEASSARFCAALALTVPGLSSLPLVSVDPLQILPATNSALTHPRPAIGKGRQEAALKAGYLDLVRDLDLVESWPQVAGDRDEVCSSFVVDYLVEEEARQRSPRTSTEKSKRREDIVKVSTHGSCCQNRSVAWVWV